MLRILNLWFLTHEKNGVIIDVADEEAIDAVSGDAPRPDVFAQMLQSAAQLPLHLVHISKKMNSVPKMSAFSRITDCSSGETALMQMFCPASQAATPLVDSGTFPVVVS